MKVSGSDGVVFMDHGAIFEQETPGSFFGSAKSERAQLFLRQVRFD
jgi:ABC-type polar amino acid transport system ATPase subunit